MGTHAQRRVLDRARASEISEILAEYAAINAEIVELSKTRPTICEYSFSSTVDRRRGNGVRRWDKIAELLVRDSEYAPHVVKRFADEVAEWAPKAIALEARRDKLRKRVKRNKFTSEDLGVHLHNFRSG